VTQDPPPRMLPALTDENRDFWTSGAGGALRVPRCKSCGRWVLPPKARCPACGGPTVGEAVSGRAALLTWTTCSHQFHPEVPVPYTVAVVVLAEQDDLRLATNLVGCEEGSLRSGMPLRVLFERHGEVHYPLFAPEAA
jgi:uncharacterized OB-fold protein